MWPRTDRDPLAAPFAAPFAQFFCFFFENLDTFFNGPSGARPANGCEASRNQLVTYKTVGRESIRNTVQKNKFKKTMLLKNMASFYQRIARQIKNKLRMGISFLFLLNLFLFPAFLPGHQLFPTASGEPQDLHRGRPQNPFPALPRSRPPRDALPPPARTPRGH